MKTPFSVLRSPLRSLSVALLCAGALSSTASGATIFAFDYQSQPVGVWFQDEHVDTTPLSVNGGLTQPGGSTNFNVAGWDLSPTINVNSPKNVTFDVSVDDGYKMTLTSFRFYANRSGGASPARPTVGAYGYRVDNGDGFGEWTLYNFALGAAGTNYMWTFDAPVVVTGTIQFGFWAAGGTQAGGIASPTGNGGTGDDMYALGTVEAIPEPSTYALIGLGAIAIWAFKRRQKSGAVTTA